MNDPKVNKEVDENPITGAFECTITNKTQRTK